MPLIVEDGSLPEGANAYADPDWAAAYLFVRGFSDWPASGDRNEEKEAALVKAADYLNGLSWHGRKVKTTQPRMMAWPRSGAYDAEGYDIPSILVPIAVKAASAYLARLIINGTDIQPILERGGRVQSESVGTISTSYFEDSPARDIITGLADLLRGLCSDFDGYAGTGTGRKGLSLIRTTV